MFRACLTMAGTFIAGAATGQLLKLESILLRNTITDSNKTVSDVVEIGKKTLVEDKDSQKPAPKPLEPSNVRAYTKEELKNEWCFINVGQPGKIRKDMQAMQDMQLKYYVECPGDKNPNSKFKGTRYITGLTDCPNACDLVNEKILDQIESGEIISRASAENFAALETWDLGSGMSCGMFGERLEEILDIANNALDTDTVFRAVKVSDGYLPKKMDDRSKPNL